MHVKKIFLKKKSQKKNDSTLTGHWRISDWFSISYTHTYTHTTFTYIHKTFTMILKKKQQQKKCLKLIDMSDISPLNSGTYMCKNNKNSIQKIFRFHHSHKFFFFLFFFVFPIILFMCYVRRRTHTYKCKFRTNHDGNPNFNYYKNVH